MARRDLVLREVGDARFRARVCSFARSLLPSFLPSCALLPLLWPSWAVRSDCPLRAHSCHLYPRRPSFICFSSILHPPLVVRNSTRQQQTASTCRRRLASSYARSPRLFCSPSLRLLLEAPHSFVPITGTTVFHVPVIFTSQSPPRPSSSSSLPPVCRSFSASHYLVSSSR